jgi:hypothetical protein
MKRKEWEALFEQSDDVDTTAAPQSSIVTPSGVEKSQRSIKRAKRWAKHDPQPELVNQSHVPSDAQNIIGSFSVEDRVQPDFRFHPHVPRSWSSEDAWLSLGPQLSTPGRTTSVASRLAYHNSPIPFPDLYNASTPGATRLDTDNQLNCNFQLPITGPSCHVISLSPTLSEIIGPFEAAHYRTWPNLFNIKLPTFRTLALALPFAKFEDYLTSRGVTFTGRNWSGLREVGPSLLNSFVLRFITDVFEDNKSPRQGTSYLQTALHRLGTLMPGENAAVITGDEAFGSKFIRLLYFAMLNGFAGLNEIPMRTFSSFSVVSAL